MKFAKHLFFPVFYCELADIWKYISRGKRGTTQDKVSNIEAVRPDKQQWSSRLMDPHKDIQAWMGVMRARWAAQWHLSLPTDLHPAMQFYKEVLLTCPASVTHVAHPYLLRNYNYVSDYVITIM